MKKALITGVTGQDGSYLAELLLEKGYKVSGLIRRSSLANFDRLENVLGHPNFSFIEGEVSDPMSVYSIVQQGQFDEIYNTAAMSHVGTSFEQPDYTFKVDALGPLYFLEAIRLHSPHTRFLTCSTSELFGKNYTENVEEKFQDEQTAFEPQSPYAVAKLAAHHLVRIYREAYGVHACAPITFNHCSPRRGENFVTRKITKWIARLYSSFLRFFEDGIGDLIFEEDFIAHVIDGEEVARIDKLRLGNINTYRDFGYAKDYVEAFWLMLQQPNPKDYVIATGETHSIRSFLEAAFDYIGVSNIENYYVIDPKFFRPAEVEFLKGSADLIKKELGWQPSVSFNELVAIMMSSEIESEKQKKETVHNKMV